MQLMNQGFTRKRELLAFAMGWNGSSDLRIAELTLDAALLVNRLEDKVVEEK